MWRRIHRDLGATATEYVAVVLVAAGVIGALIAARYDERVATGVRVAVCRLFSTGVCEATAPGDAGPSGVAGGPAPPGDTVVADGTGGGGAGAPLLQASAITGGPLATTALGTPVGVFDDPDGDTSDDQGLFITNPGEYARQDETFQDQDFRVRGYLHPRCLEGSKQLFDRATGADVCTSMWGNRFRAEYTAQAAAIRQLSNMGGRLSFYERHIQRDPVDNNVHWEVGFDDDPLRIDIWVHDPETNTDNILEVRRWQGPRTIDDVDATLTEHERRLGLKGVRVGRNSELSEIQWAITITQPPSLGDRLRGDGGTDWHIWADPQNPGHIYYASEEDEEHYRLPEGVVERSKRIPPRPGNTLPENVIPGDLPVPIPVPAPVPVPIVP